MLTLLLSVFINNANPVQKDFIDLFSGVLIVKFTDHDGNLKDIIMHQVTDHKLNKHMLLPLNTDSSKQEKINQTLQNTRQS